MRLMETFRLEYVVFYSNQNLLQSPSCRVQSRFSAKVAMIDWEMRTYDVFHGLAQVDIVLPEFRQLCSSYTMNSLARSMK